MDKESKEETREQTTWERVKFLNLPNQVRKLCDCIDEMKNSSDTETKPPKK